MNKFSQTHYQQSLNEKITHFKTLFNVFSLPEIEIYSSQPLHYRMRAEFRIWHKGEEINHIMYDQIQQKRISIDDFPVATQIINLAMKAIIPLLKYNLVLREKLFQIDYLSTTSNQLLISLIYHKKLDDTWQHQAELLKEALIKQGIQCHLIGRAANQKICLNQDFVDEQLAIEGRNYIYRQVENSFTQPNAGINIAMLSWAIQATKNAKGDLLELYCGNGNFSIALAQNFRQVLATEVAKSSVKAAQYNIAINKIDNVKIVRLSAEELTEAITNQKTFKRLNGITLSDYQCQTVLVDPPRSGLDSDTLRMISEYETIIYISCNPITLKENLITLTKTHQIKQIAIFDQFPYTAHLECGVILNKSY